MEAPILTKELDVFIEEYSPLKYSETLVKMGFTNSRNVLGNRIEKRTDGTIIFTEQNVKDFCKKYNLFYADANRYTGYIPTENIKAIEAYKPHDVIYRYFNRTGYDYYYDDSDVCFTTEAVEETKDGFFSRKRYRLSDGKIATNCTSYHSSYIIVAPKKDFNVEMDEESRTVQNTDPAIFEKFFDVETKTYKYQLVTCWGYEQATEELQKDALN